MRAFERPMAIACFLLFTFLPLRPLFNLPCFISRISVSMFLLALGEYLRLDFFFDEDFFAAVRRPEGRLVEDFLAEDLEEDFFVADFLEEDFLVEDFLRVDLVAIIQTPQDSDGGEFLSGCLCGRRPTGISEPHSTFSPMRSAGHRMPSLSIHQCEKRC